MLLAGTTCCCDGYFLEDMVAKAIGQAGMRAVVGQGVIDFPAPGVADPSDNLAVASSFVREHLTASRLVTPSVFCHSPYICSENTLVQTKALAEKTGVLFQIHAAETRREFDQIQAAHGVTPVHYLDRMGLLDPHTLLVHCIWITDEDIDVIARRGARVSHCPESNMKLAAGIAPVPGLLAAGVTVGLGSDGCASNNDLNLFHEMGTTARLHKAVSGQPTVMDAGTVVKMATSEGAAAIGLAHQTGSLETGKQADVIVINTRQPHMTPMYHPQSHVVYAAGPADVSHVVVAGRILVADGRLTGLDLDEIIAHVNKIAFKIRTGGAT
jgi:5-methylthioadenosine/S-adenosylhomocysteine deaminase